MNKNMSKPTRLLKETIKQEENIAKIVADHNKALADDRIIFTKAQSNFQQNTDKANREVQMAHQQKDSFIKEELKKLSKVERLEYKKLMLKHALDMQIKNLPNEAKDMRAKIKQTKSAIENGKKQLKKLEIEVKTLIPNRKKQLNDIYQKALRNIK